MIGYTMVGVKDLERAKQFYDPLFELMGLSPCYSDEQVVSWGDKADPTIPRFFVCHPFDGGAAASGNGTMTAFQIDSASSVDRLYDIALRGGGRDEGKPGFRPETYGDQFYVAYVRDLDGNKLAFACYDGKANP
ncbi:MAG: VOC family protein [Pseudomonadota bacterium]